MDYDLMEHSTGKYLGKTSDPVAPVQGYIFRWRGEVWKVRAAHLVYPVGESHRGTLTVEKINEEEAQP